MKNRTKNRMKNTTKNKQRRRQKIKSRKNKMKRNAKRTLRRGMKGGNEEDNLISFNDPNTQHGNLITFNDPNTQLYNSYEHYLSKQNKQPIRNNMMSLYYGLSNSNPDEKPPPEWLTEKYGSSQPQTNSIPTTSKVPERKMIRKPFSFIKKFSSTKNKPKQHKKIDEIYYLIIGIIHGIDLYILNNRYIESGLSETQYERFSKEIDFVIKIKNQLTEYAKKTNRLTKLKEINKKIKEEKSQNKYQYMDKLLDSIETEINYIIENIIEKNRFSFWFQK